MPQVGQTAQFTLNPFNTGPSSVDASTGVTVVDTVPDNFTAPITGSGNGPTWTCTTAGYVVTCVYSGPAVGAHQQLPSITISAVARHPGDYINCANIFMRRRNGPRGPVNPVDLNGIKDENPRDNRGCADGRVDSGKGGSHNVSIRKLGGGTVAQGGQITFNIDVFNLADATGPITVVDTLPAGLTNAVVPTGTPWNCTVSGNVITCVYSGSQVGHNLHFPQLNITATANSAGSFTNCAKVTINGATDSDMQDNRDCRSYEVTGRPSAKLTIVKDATPNDAQDFGFHGSGPMGQYILPFTLDDDAGAAGADNQHASSKTFTLPLGSYTITEDMTQGWTVGSIVCTPAGATVNLANRQFTLNLTNGADVTCTFNNQKNTAQDTASLTIIKDATPNDAQDFAFHGFGPNSSYIYPFTLDDDAGAAGADNQHSNSKTFPLPAGSYSITEDATSGWTLTGIVCTQAGATIDMSNRSFTLNLAAGAHVTCTFSNQKNTPQSTASITIIKVASPNDPQDFQFTGTGNGVHDFSLDDDPSDGALPNRITFNNLMPGNYSFSELPTAGWTSGGTGNGGGINCGDTPHPTRSSFSSTPSSVSIGLVAGDSVFCTVINTKQAPQGNASITIIKVASPNDPQDFQFTTSGSGVHDFSLDDDPSDGALPNSITFTHLMPGPYNFSEVATAGWTSGGTGYQGVINCQQHPNPTRSQFGPTMNSVTVYLEAGDSVVCTFINTKQQATGSGSVTIIKDAQPDNGQDFLFTFGTSGGVFALDDDGGADNTLLDHTTLPGLAAGAWTFTENAVSGWDVVAITCSPSASATTDVANRKVTINVTNGSATTCTFTNRQQ